MIPCDDWQIIVAEQNRAEVLNLNDPGGDSRIHVEAFLNNSSGECNSSPQLGLLTLPFVCVGNDFFYNLSSAIAAVTPAFAVGLPSIPLIGLFLWLWLKLIWPRLRGKKKKPAKAT